ncbi:hypothetical protein MetMK1DRAFT_00026690 [Metallosphaera yellowstonensis MK1]|uniref:Uncharacterized protein n=1 Tax=Metallosphaera yellowstonensis MK1 TaxID=671065 RepID=H2C7X0_9CREN|nr:thioredoxin family protein [Metallosphaera yellowstonensis]EHP68246.1 hypothetical protein MetMK1DRAFT_00026690 [Metallosphaera yellowstonensis MK1]
MSYDYVIRQYLKAIKDITLRHCKASDFVEFFRSESIRIEDEGNCQKPEIHVYLSDGKYFSYYGIPSMNELWPFLNALVRGSTGAIQLDSEELQLAKKVKGDIKLFVTPECTKCPITAELLYQVALVNRNVKLEVVDSELYDDLSKKYRVMNVPKIILNEKVEIPGGFPPHIVLKMLAKSSEATS